MNWEIFWHNARQFLWIHCVISVVFSIVSMPHVEKQIDEDESGARDIVDEHSKATSRGVVYFGIFIEFFGIYLFLIKCTN